jgi:hypothetical protein
MSHTQNASAALTDGEKDRKPQEQSQRFTPLRSYVARAREARNDLALSRLIPLPRLQS